MVSLRSLAAPPLLLLLLVCPVPSLLRIGDSPKLLKEVYDFLRIFYPFQVPKFLSLVLFEIGRLTDFLVYLIQFLVLLLERLVFVRFLQ